MTENLIIIPARMGSTRFPGKILADIMGKTMIERVVGQALAANCADIAVAICEEEVRNILAPLNIKIIMTNPDLPSGTDRIAEALNKLDEPRQYKYVMNLQGDLPLINPQIIKSSFDILKNNKNADIVTPISLVSNDNKPNNPNSVKVVIRKDGRAIYFSRSMIPYDVKQYWHHIGIYGYHREALENFVRLPVSHLEAIEKLEQLRAIESGMKIFVNIVDSVPLSVDTIEDLHIVLEYMKKNKNN